MTMDLIMLANVRTRIITTRYPFYFCIGVTIIPGKGFSIGVTERDKPI